MKRGARKKGMDKMLEVIKQLHEKKGYYYRKWKKGVIAFAKRLEKEGHKKKTRKVVKKKSKRRKGRVK